MEFVLGNLKATLIRLRQSFQRKGGKRLYSNIRDVEQEGDEIHISLLAQALTQPFIPEVTMEVETLSLPLGLDGFPLSPVPPNFANCSQFANAGGATGIKELTVSYTKNTTRTRVASGWLQSVQLVCTMAFTLVTANAGVIMQVFTNDMTLSNAISLYGYANSAASGYFELFSWGDPTEPNELGGLASFDFQNEDGKVIWYIGFPMNGLDSPYSDSITQTFNLPTQLIPD
jgi:hypothetical protein